MDFAEKYLPGLSYRLSESICPVPWGVVIINLVLVYSYRAQSTNTFPQRVKGFIFPLAYVKVCSKRLKKKKKNF